MDNEPSKSGFYVVATYLVTREYGGPEEGGWYYDHAVPVDTIDDEDWKHMAPVITRDEGIAISTMKAAQQILDATVNKDRYPLSSVLSTGRYQARVSDGWPKEEPAERPRYE